MTAHLRITRPKGRVRIETTTTWPRRPPATASPGRKAGCGLKPQQVLPVTLGGQASPGRKAGCGLKPAPLATRHRRSGCITRPKGRVRIETSSAPAPSTRRTKASPGRKAGCGLKHRHALSAASTAAASPGRKAGCGLKPCWAGGQSRSGWAASPGRKAGCGLKLRLPLGDFGPHTHHPAERPGAD